MSQSKVSVGLVNPKSPENVASVMRSAGNFRVGHILYTGMRYFLAQQHSAVSDNISRKVGRNIPVSQVDCLVTDVSQGVKIVCVELVENSISLPDFKHPESALYVFGPEDGSIGQSVIDKADYVVYVPTEGCMNLAATVNVVLYDRLAKLSKRNEGNELIRKSRDTNNNLRLG